MRLLRDDTRVDRSEIEVHVEEETVYLTGTVDSAAERQAVQEDVQAVAPAGSIVNQITLRNYVERTDDELREAVRHALIRDVSVDVGPIDVAAKDGEITLSGIVQSRAQRNAAEDVAWWTPGVTNVTSRLQVESESETPLDLKD